MVLLCFLNEHDKDSYLLGRDLPSHIYGDYAKIFTRYDDSVYEKCEVKDTMNKIREYAQVFDVLMISFGLRLFPPSAYKDIINKYRHTTDNLVFLKELRGSKTWTITEDGRLNFSNVRIADSGVFILQSSDVLKSKCNNFNSFIKELIKQNKLKHVFVDYWIFTNQPSKRVRYKSRMFSKKRGER